jgi:hypothetical protein
MLTLNGLTLSRLARISWDGRRTAAVGVAHRWDGTGGYAPSGVEHVDEVFEDLDRGIVGGRMGGSNDAEVTILRTRFLRCRETGVSIESWNALNYWIWDSEFENNARGVTNEFGAGNFCVYRSTFRGSTVADITLTNTSFFTFRGNTSIGSRKFLSTGGPTSNPAEITIQENTIIDPLDQNAIVFQNAGPLVLLDNTIRSLSKAGPVVQHRGKWVIASVISTGNTYTVSDWLGLDSHDGRLTTFGDVVVDARSIPDPTPILLEAAPNLGRSVYDVPAGTTAAVIQRVINSAVAEGGRHRPVIHLPAGVYSIERPLVLPANTDVQIVGDGLNTVLSWFGGRQGKIFDVDGPTHVVFRDLKLIGGRQAEAIVLRNADQPGARVYTEDTRFDFEQGTQFGVLTDGLSYTDVQMHGDCVIVTGRNPAISVIGSGAPGSSRIALYGAQAGLETRSAPTLFDVANGGRLFVQDLWYEAPGPNALNLTHDGAFTLWSGHLAARAASPATPYITLNGFEGQATVFGVELDQLGNPGRNIQVLQETSRTKALFLGLTGQNADYFVRPGSMGQVGFSKSTWKEPERGMLRFLPEQGDTTQSFFAEMLAFARATKPLPLADLKDGITDVRIHRVGFSETTTALHVKP